MKSVDSEKTAARELAADDCGLLSVPEDAPVPEAFRRRPLREPVGDACWRPSWSANARYGMAFKTVTVTPVTDTEQES